MQKIYSDETFRSRKFSFDCIHSPAVKGQNGCMKEKQLTPEEVAKNRHTLRFVKSWMKLRKITQRKLAEDLSMSEPSVSKWLNGKVNMTLSQFVRVAEILEARPEELLFDPAEKDKAQKYKEAAELAENLDPAAFEAWIAAGKAMRKRD
ncbi:helix-turn-helix domain-containing protein [Acetobacter persici]|uniref:HTH cro/C1-type domain-containing protein n=1 Tax=Acetobacter persici TaxID=1076596 RepID=A0A6V8IBH3_9PROT|nr:helix-turn-helix transcriptional regulator [Acetobacter persici]GFE94407.1 hypothetical protein DmAi_24660 [Acetobacter persici]